MAYENFAKTCIGTKQWMTNIGQPEHIPMAQTCEIYLCSIYKYSRLACKKCDAAKNQIFVQASGLAMRSICCSGVVFCYS